MKQVVLAALFAISSPVFAQGYVGFGLGQSSVDIESNPDTTNIDDRDASFRLFGGVELNQNLAIEAGYVDLGEFSRSEAGITTDGTNVYDFAGKQRIEAIALYAALVGKLQLGPAFELFAKAGLARWETDYALSGYADVYDGSGTTYLGTVSLSDRESESGIDPMFGIGINFNASDKLILRAEFDRFTDVGEDETTGQSDVDVIGLSAAVKF